MKFAEVDILIVMTSVCLSFSRNLNTSSLDCEKVVAYEVLVVKSYFKLGESLKNRMWNENTVYACTSSMLNQGYMTETQWSFSQLKYIIIAWFTVE